MCPEQDHDYRLSQAHEVVKRKMQKTAIQTVEVDSRSTGRFGLVNFAGAPGTKGQHGSGWVFIGQVARAARRGETGEPVSRPVVFSR